jgi:hypothetical protein
MKKRDPDLHPDPNSDLDPLVRGMDPRIRIRIHTKMSWIRNTGLEPNVRVAQTLQSIYLIIKFTRNCDEI